MNKEELYLDNGLDENAIVLEPFGDLSKAIIGTSSDGKHVVYGYDELVKALSSDEESDEKVQEAVDWIDHNTLGMMPNWSEEFRPIVMYHLY